MKNDKKPQVSKENGEMFETVFGKDMKAEGVEYVDKKESVIKSMIDGGNTPLGLKIISSVFGYLQSFFTMFLPIGLLISTCIKHNLSFNRELILSIMTVLGISLGSFCILKIIEFLISALLIWMYSNILTDISGRTAVLQERIRSHLKTENAEDLKKEENKPHLPETMNPEESPMAMVKAVERLMTLYIAHTMEKDPSATLPNNDILKRTFMTILFNIYKQGYNGKNDIPAKDVLTGVDNPFKFDIFEFIIQWAKATDWFTKPF